MKYITIHNLLKKLTKHAFDNFLNHTTRRALFQLTKFMIKDAFRRRRARIRSRARSRVAFQGGGAEETRPTARGAAAAWSKGGTWRRPGG